MAKINDKTHRALRGRFRKDCHFAGEQTGEETKEKGSQEAIPEVKDQVSKVQTWKQILLFCKLLEPSSSNQSLTLPSQGFTHTLPSFTYLLDKCRCSGDIPASLT